MVFFTSGGLILLTNVALIMDSKNETCPVPRDIFQYFWGGAALSFFPGGVGRGSIENFPGRGRQGSHVSGAWAALNDDTKILTETDTETFFRDQIL